MASGIVGTLRARMGLDAGPFRRGLQQQRGVATAFAGQIRRIMAPVAAAMAGAFSAAAVKNAMGTIDAQAKLAKSLGTTSQSLQVLQRAGDLAGVSLGSIEQGTKDLFRRLSQAASGGGPAADALERLGLSASELLDIPLDQRLAKINSAITEFIPEAQRAAVAGALFGEEGSIALSRLDPTVIAQATEELRQFGFAISETDASKIELANDSLSKLGLIAQGLISQITVALAPALGAMADGFANAMREGAPMRTFIETLGANIGRIAAYAMSFAAFMAGQWVAAMGAAVIATASVSGALTVLRTAIMRTGFGVLIIAAGELALQFTRLVERAGGFGNAMELLGDVAKAVFQGVIDSAAAVPIALDGVWQLMKGGFLISLSDMATAFHDFVWTIANAFQGIQGLEGIGGDLMGLANAASDVSGTLHRSGADAKGDAAGRMAAAGAKISEAFGPARDAVSRLKDAMTGAGEDGANAIDGARDSLEKLNEVAEDGASGGAGSGGAAGNGLDKLKEKAVDLKDTVSQVKETMRGLFTGVVTGTKTARDAVSELLGKFGEMLSNKAFDSIWNVLSGAGGSGGGGGLGKLLGSLIPGFASGTSFAPGGWSQVNERGGELINLPRGSQVIPHDISRRMADKSGGVGKFDVRVYVDDNGNFDAKVERISGGMIVRAAPGLVQKSVQATYSSSRERPLL